MKVVISQMIDVDDCIAQEIVYINSIGIRTEGCCCGHGETVPSAIIKPSSIQKARESGYSPVFYPDMGHGGQWSIILNSRCCCKGR